MRNAALVLAFLVACGGGKSNPQPVDQNGQIGQSGQGGQGGSNGCIKTGCSATICADPGKDVITTCEFKPEYACYQKATCAKQSDGACGWTQTPELTGCLANPPPGAAGSAAPVM